MIINLLFNTFKLTRLREKILNQFGIKSMSILDIRKIFRCNLPYYANHKSNFETNKQYLKKDISILSSLILKSLARFASFTRSHLDWRFLMQSYINKYFPHKKKKLDYGSCDLRKISEKNNIFREKFLREFTFNNFLMNINLSNLIQNIKINPIFF